MAKKCLLALILAAFITGSAFAMPDLNFSVGAGVYLTGDFGGGWEASGGGDSLTWKTPYFGGGGFIFFDATFAELSLGFFGAGGNMTFEGRFGGQTISDRERWSVGGFDIGLLGKYPVVMSDQLTLFPLLGLSYRVIFSARMDGESICDPGDFSALWFKFGGGLDFAVNNRVFLRGQALYGFRVRNRFERDSVNDWGRYPGVNASARLGHGLSIRFGVGYRF